MLSTIEVGGGDCGLDAGLQHGTGEFAAFGLIGDVAGTVGAVIGVAASHLVLGFFEVGQDGVPVPADAAALTPFVVVGVMSSYIQHAVD